ncbi:MAG: precorrin-3B C(17)-methyltransferase [Syntrophaceae bacterium]
MGPGGAPDRTHRAEEAIAQSDLVVGYVRYLRLIEDLTAQKETISTGMTREVQRCRIAVERALSGEVVTLVSSGDPGVYGMAGLALELAGSIDPSLDIEIVPGVSAANAAAARMGAPLMMDYAVISLSDLLVPWETIRRRLEAVALADLVTALYNPRSKKRIHQLEEAAEIFLRHRPAGTPVGIGTAIGTPEEQVVLTALGRLLTQTVNMNSIVIVGNSHSKIVRNRFLTPRGYRV